jgi:predicted MPP superfamily phosphohydrolase
MFMTRKHSAALILILMAGGIGVGRAPAPEPPQASGQLRETLQRLGAGVEDLKRRFTDRLAIAEQCGLDDWFRTPANFNTEDHATLDAMVQPERLDRERVRAMALAVTGRTTDACRRLMAVERPPEDPPAIPDTAADVCKPHCLTKREVGPSHLTDRARFVVVGDVGEFEDGELHADHLRVAARVREVCAASTSPQPAPACAFVMLLGDNLYPSGVSDVEEEARLGLAVRSYQLPAYLVLGNHDWHPFFARLGRAQQELAWIGRQDDVRGNAHFYDFLAGPVHFWGLDTNYLVRRKKAAEELGAMKWFQEIGTSNAPWRIAFGHHGYLSNGPHGNAGSFKDAVILHWRGKEFKSFLEARVLSKVDLYIAGHDHNLQFYDRKSARQPAAAVMISGAGTKATEREKSPANEGSEAPLFEKYVLGFTVLDATATQLTVEMHFLEGTKWSIWRVTRQRNNSAWVPLSGTRP